jgi:hypothetical protein
MLNRAPSQRAQLGAISSDKGNMTAHAPSYPYITRLDATATVVTTGER